MYCPLLRYASFFFLPHGLMTGRPDTDAVASPVRPMPHHGCPFFGPRCSPHCARVHSGAHIHTYDSFTHIHILESELDV